MIFCYLSLYILGPDGKTNEGMEWFGLKNDMSGQEIYDHHHIHKKVGTKQGNRNLTGLYHL